MILLFGTIFAGLLGLCFGSFLNVCLSRWPAGESIVRPRSHCRHCGRSLTWWENLPLVSWLALRGRCRTCRAWIGWRYPLVELAMGILWAYTFWGAAFQLTRPDFSSASEDAVLTYIELELAFGTMAFLWALIGLAVLDFEHLWLPDLITLPGIALGIIFHSAIVGQLHWFYIENPWPWIGRAVGGRLLSAVAAAILVLLIRWSYKLIRHREGVGLGDAKLMALLAAWLGLPSALLAFVVGIVLGALAAVAALLVPSWRREPERWSASKLPLGTFLCIGGMVSSLWGKPILAVYLRWAGF